MNLTLFPLCEAWSLGPREKSDWNKRGAWGRRRLRTAAEDSEQSSAQGQHRSWLGQALCACEGSVFGRVSWERKKQGLRALSPVISLLLFVKGCQYTGTFLRPLSKILLSKDSHGTFQESHGNFHCCCFPFFGESSPHWKVWWWFLASRHWMVFLCVPCTGAEFCSGLVEWPYLFVLAVWVVFLRDGCLAGSLLFCQPHPIVFLSRGNGPRAWSCKDLWLLYKEWKSCRPEVQFLNWVNILAQGLAWTGPAGLKPRALGDCRGGMVWCYLMLNTPGFRGIWGSEAAEAFVSGGEACLSVNTTENLASGNLSFIHSL